MRSIDSDRISVVLGDYDSEMALDFAQRRSAHYESIRARNPGIGYGTNDVARQLPGTRSEHAFATVCEDVFGDYNVARTYEDDLKKPWERRAGDIQVHGVAVEVKCLKASQWSDDFTWNNINGEVEYSLATMVPTKHAYDYQKADADTAIVFATYEGDKIVFEGFIPVHHFIEDGEVIDRPCSPGNPRTKFKENIRVDKEQLYPMSKFKDYINYLVE